MSEATTVASQMSRADRKLLEDITTGRDEIESIIDKSQMTDAEKTFARKSLARYMHVSNSLMTLRNHVENSNRKKDEESEGYPMSTDEVKQYDEYAQEMLASMVSLNHYVIGPYQKRIKGKAGGRAEIDEMDEALGSLPFRIDW